MHNSTAHVIYRPTTVSFIFKYSLNTFSKLLTLHKTGYIPAGTQRSNDVELTSRRRDDVTPTSI